MVIRDRLTTIQLLMVLAAALMLWLGCGSEDESIIESDTTVGPDISTEKPESAIPTDSPKAEVEEVEDVSVTVRGLVLDQVTKTPLIDVRVQLTDEAGVVVEILTTPLGVFEFKDISADQRLTIAIDSDEYKDCLLYTSPSPRDGLLSRMPSSA